MDVKLKLKFDADGRGFVVEAIGQGLSSLPIPMQ